MSSLINIAGTNGAGKSTIVRGVLAQASQRTPVMVPGRETPMGYDLRLPGIAADIHVMGAYEVPTGGCDTIKDVEIAFGWLEKQWGLGKSIIYEGAFVMNMQRGPEMVRRCPWPVYVMLLTTPLATCFQAIADRRAKQGEGAFVQRKNIEGHHVRATNYAAKMRAAGAKVRRVSREEALPAVMQILREGGEPS